MFICNVIVSKNLLSGFDVFQECFTRVLKGHINLATAIFPENVNGM